MFFFFNDTATTQIYALSLHDALPISVQKRALSTEDTNGVVTGYIYEENNLNITILGGRFTATATDGSNIDNLVLDRKSTRLNSSHANISYAVFCLKKQTNSTSVSTSQ